MKILNIKNSNAIYIRNVINLQLVNIKCSYNVIFDTIKNINQLKIIESRVIFNKPLININFLYIKMINNYFLIPSNSIIFKIIYLYKYYINLFTIENIRNKYNINESTVNKIDLYHYSKNVFY